MFCNRSPRATTTVHPLPFNLFLYLLGLIVQLIFAGGLFIAANGPTDAWAQTAAAPVVEQVQTVATRHYDIPSGPLNTVLTRFSTESGIFLVGANDLAQGKNSPGIRGTFSVQKALDVLLAETGLETQRNAQGQYVLQPAVSAVGTLPLMTVSTSADSLKQGTAEEGYRVSNISGIGLWSERSLRDTPYSMSVVPSDLIENVNAQNMGQIFKMNPLTQEPIIQNFNNAPYAVIRGFLSINPVYDGIPMAAASGSAVSVIEIDRVEILSGTSGFLYGGGRVGGAINYVTKSPTDIPLRRLTFGNYGGTQFYGHADISGKFDNQGRFGYRANLLYQGGDTAIGEPVNQKVANIVLDGHLTDTLYANIKYTYNDYSREATQPSFNNIRDRAGIDISKRYSPKWASSDIENHKAYTSLRWDPSQYFTLRSAFSYQRNDARADQISFNEQADRTFIPRIGNVFWTKYENYGGYIYLDTRFSAFVVDHKLTLGYSSTFYDYFTHGNGSISRSSTSSLPLSELKNIPEPEWGSVGNEPLSSVRATRYNNILIGDNITFNDQWSAMVGLNYSTVMNKTAGDFFGNSKYDKSALTPTGSLLYKPRLRR